ncbi:NUDIX domain-containing protein [Sphingobacterium sp. lm-10]|uniref:NUDIX hydrolase n=1 Tax=Sphingobacterium sp. lm-10 TaxID=2944904 RepID=UPI002022867D|nr:NUDIX domain-containing protein [Sphingobacterium sp. lm-10]MCL7987347.1 NUDIX domain-containing protein [Sphingobacterium sp. lm-10]
MNQNLLILADFVPQHLVNPQTIGLQEIDIEKLFKASTSLSDPITYLLILPDPTSFFKSLLENIKVIKAAGGVVKNGHGEYLFIHRLGKWDLPKGKLEEDEKVRSAAKREVEEECGVKVDYLGAKFCTTYHTYTMRGKVVLKQTNWYEMGVNKSPELIPQLEEDIDEAAWVDIEDFDTILDDTYPLIADIAKSILYQSSDPQ